MFFAGENPSLPGGNEPEETVVQDPEVQDPVRDTELTASQPPMYQVFLLNDDFTPMDFVVVVLEKFFGMSRERAMEVMLTVHILGKGLCGTYSQDIAATKVEKVRQYARQHQHPLQCMMEKA